MIRVILVNLLFLLLPSIIYFSYVYLRGDSKSGEEAVSNAPILWLLILGVMLMVSTLFIFGKWEGSDPSKQYYPPVYRDGVIVPGHVE